MGVCLGMMGISRQWALLIFPAFLIPLYYIKISTDLITLSSLQSHF